MDFRYVGWAHVSGNVLDCGETTFESNNLTEVTIGGDPAHRCKFQRAIGHTLEVDIKSNTLTVHDFTAMGVDGARCKQIERFSDNAGN